MKQNSLTKVSFYLLSIMVWSAKALAAGSPAPCEVKVSASQFQSWMKQYVYSGANGRRPAGAFYEVDSNGRVLRQIYGQNQHVAQAVASTQKIVTAYTAHRVGGANRVVTWNSEDSLYDGQGARALLLSSNRNPSIGQTLRASEYFKTLMNQSSNGAALALSRSIDSGSTRAFVQSMNNYSRSLIGSETTSFNTYFQNPAGLTDTSSRYEFGDPNQKQRSTADNMARLTARIMGDSGFRSQMVKYGLGHYNGGVMMKWGYTAAAGRTLIAHIPLKGCKTKSLVYAAFGEAASAQGTRLSQMHSQILRALGY